MRGAGGEPIFEHDFSPGTDMMTEIREGPKGWRWSLGRDCEGLSEELPNLLSIHVLYYEFGGLHERRNSISSEGD